MLSTTASLNRHISTTDRDIGTKQKRILIARFPLFPDRVSTIQFFSFIRKVRNNNIRFIDNHSNTLNTCFFNKMRNSYPCKFKLRSRWHVARACKSTYELHVSPYKSIYTNNFHPFDPESQHLHSFNERRLG